MAGEDQHELILLDFWPSMFSMRVKLALAEKGITDYDCREENLIVSKSPLLLEMNPVHKKIPVLIHKGKPICESLNIVEYIDEVWKDNKPSLLPSDPYERSQARFWAAYADKFYVGGNKVWTATGESRETGKNEMIEVLKTLEQQLGDKSYFAGDNFGFVDIAFIPFYTWFETFELCGNFSIEALCPKIIAWGKRCFERETVSSNLPDMHKVTECVMGIRKTMGIE